jgi:hypothetical protein
MLRDERKLKMKIFHNEEERINQLRKELRDVEVAVQDAETAQANQVTFP